ncbi:MAG: caspase family protein [Chitinophagaceae bacterium]
MQKIILTAILLIFLATTWAQKLYSIRYTDDKDVAYDCFMVYFNPHNIYLRVRYQSDDSTFNVVHVDYSSVTGKMKNGKPYLIMKADPDTHTVMGDTNATAYYIPENFYWYPQEKNEKSRGPFLTRDVVGFTFNGSVDSYFPYKPDHLTEKDLLEYYQRDEGDFEDLKTMCGLDESQERWTPPAYKIKPTLHFIMVANTLEKKIGASCKTDVENLQDELEHITGSLGISFKPYIVDDKDFSKPALIKALSQVQPGPDDIIFFSYSGHGSRWADQKDSFPYMDLNIKQPTKTYTSYEEAQQEVLANSLTMTDLTNLIIDKPARLNIVLGDMCNKSNTAPGPRLVSTESYEMNWDRGVSDGLKVQDLLKLKALFMDTKGNVISVATRPDETAGGTTQMGGYFTKSFIESLETGTSFFNHANSSWQSIINETLKNAEIYKKKSNSPVPQTGLKHIYQKQ